MYWKCVVNVCNAAIMLCGIGMISLGVYGIVVSAPFVGLVGNDLGFLLVLGMLLFVTACFGVYTTLTEKHYLLKIVRAHASHSFLRSISLSLLC